MLFFLMWACTSSKTTDSSVDLYLYPDPSDMPELRGAGGPSVTFSEEELFQNCSPLFGGEDDGDDSKDDDDDCDAARLEIVDRIEIRKKSSSSFVCSSGSFEPVEIENGRVRAEKQIPAERFDD